MLRFPRCYKGVYRLSAQNGAGRSTLDPPAPFRWRTDAAAVQTAALGVSLHRSGP